MNTAKGNSATGSTALATRAPNERRAVLLALATALMWSTVATAFKLALVQLSPAQLLLGGHLVGVLVLLVAVARRHGLRAITRKLLVHALPLGLLNPVLYYAVLFAAYDRLPAQIAQPLNCTWSIVLALLAVPMLGQPLSARALLALALSYLGVLITVTDGQFSLQTAYDGTGIALALGSTLIWATYWLLTARDTRPPELLLCGGMLAALPFSLAYCVLTDGLPAPSWPLLFGSLWVGCFELGFAFLTWLAALRLTQSAARMSQLALFSPLLSPLWIYLVLQEPLHWASMVGLLLIVIGAVLVPRPQQPPQTTA